MFELIGLGLTLFILAALWPPYNVFIAQAFSEKNPLLYFSVILPSLCGLFTGGTIIGIGTKLLGIPLELFGGIFILGIGVKMLLPKKNQDSDIEFKKKLSNSIQAAFSCFFMSAMPGVFTVALATALNPVNIPQILAVTFFGATLGNTAGGILLYKGTKLMNLPLKKIGGILLLFIGVLTIKPYIL
jgi:hypothetical protein